MNNKIAFTVNVFTAALFRVARDSNFKLPKSTSTFKFIYFQFFGVFFLENTKKNSQQINK